MPIYVYRCKDCEDEFELKQSIKDDPAKECGLCQGELYRVVQPAGVVYNCGGFYVTDYKGREKSPLRYTD
jgi:putative FmdB family regulatory protein